MPTSEDFAGNENKGDECNLDIRYLFAYHKSIKEARQAEILSANAHLFSC